ncbi:hypothetical protein [Gelidibacter maritimus]|uniref:Uncharacterized protein n=1 Tax=Gelidibacter maritimus TaxID=2761487 RepID=A0A7W2M2I5_9FLAO|nr:hypothetical protein [Gelidibacter maritimus]MBA6151460.1 hypothetical protein [Gelidibacter maritimus]
MEHKVYKREEIASNEYRVFGGDGKVLKNHKNKPYPNLSERASQNLIDDLNAVNLKNRELIFQNNSEKDALVEIAAHNRSNRELNQSLCYCVISTLMEYQEHNSTIELELELSIQWDRLFRLTPGPPYLLIELRNTAEAQEFFGQDYVNLPLNYCQSVEEMEENKIELVPENTIKIVADLVQEMSMAEKVMVDILYNLFQYFSITIPILWVAGKIDDEAFIASYYALHMNVDIYEMDHIEFERPSFEMNRLLYLNALKKSYQDEDQSLPCANS